MKKITFLYFALFTTSIVFAQLADPQDLNTSIFNVNTEPTSNRDLFDVQFIYNIGISGSTENGALTGVVFFEDQFWISRWNSDQIFILSTDNTLLEEITIPGLTGVRTFSTDGTNIFAGTAESTIYVIDPVSRTIIDTIEETSEAVARMVIYDENLDEGNGGFWIGGFSNGLIAAIDMEGNELRLIQSTAHQTFPYDGVVDYISEGGPYIWIHDLTTALGDFIVQLDMETGNRTGIIYNFEDDSPFPDVQAGGLFLTNEIDADGEYSLIGVSQSFPSNLLFAVELSEPLSVHENKLSNVQLIPNPATGSFVTIEGTANSRIEIVLMDAFGKIVKQEILDDSILSIEHLTSGFYLLKIIQDGNSTVKKLVIN